MAQVVIWAHRAVLAERRAALSDAIHGAVMAALDYPADDYTIIEISMFEGRSEAAKRALIAELFERVEREAGVPPHSLEITITETPKVNWGIRGRNAADLALN